MIRLAPRRKLILFPVLIVLIVCLDGWMRHKTIFFEQPKEQYSILPTIFIITPTYSRLQQEPELIRLSNTLQLVTNIHWIVVEDSENKTELVTNILSRCNILFTHLNDNSPNAVKDRNITHRGVTQRNAALAWIRRQPFVDGVVYFADDDNTYDILVFDEMRYTKNVSVWPVGLTGGLLYEAPLLTEGKVTGWITSYSNRKFQTDMAGFALNLRTVQRNPLVYFRLSCKAGRLEDDLLRQFGFELHDLEPKANNCTKVLVWHTKTQKYSLPNATKPIKHFGTKM